MVGPPLVCGGCRGEAGPYPVGMSVAKRLREARLAAGLTQAQLAQRVGVADGTRVAAWEHGRSTPHPATWATICSLLGIELEEAGVVMVPGGAFGTSFPHHVRLAATVPEERLREAFGRMKPVLEGLVRV